MKVLFILRGIVLQNAAIERDDIPVFERSEIEKEGKEWSRNQFFLRLLYRHGEIYK
jgi:hypothetical protein